MIDKLLEFLSEDLGKGDITTDSLITQKTICEAVIITNENGVLAGLKEAARLIDHFGLQYKADKIDGQKISKGEKLVVIKGDLRDILRVERLILNLLSRMSGIATLTRKLSAICDPQGVKIMGTRKTTPGFREFEKRAIQIGGGLSHRQGLYDEVLIKDNHLFHLSVEDAVKKARMNDPGKRIEIEVSNLDDAREAIKAGAEIIMFDNLSYEEVRKNIETLEEEGLRRAVEIELSGGINSENIKAYSRTGADRISLGSLTTNARWLDFSLRVID